jgi:hypothetical protein
LSSKEHSYSTEVITISPNVEIQLTTHKTQIPHLQYHPRPLPPRVAAMLKILVVTFTIIRSHFFCFFLSHYKICCSLIIPLTYCFSIVPLVATLFFHKIYTYMLLFSSLVFSQPNLMLFDTLMVLLQYCFTYIS